MIAIHSLLTENELADEFVAALQARRFAEKFFYWFPLSVRAWLALCSDGAYRNYVRSRSLIAQSADDLARTVSPGPPEVLSLGSGQGDKDLLLMPALPRPHDSLIVDGEIYAAQQTVAGYDNPLNRRFAWAPLVAVGITEQDGALVFEDGVDARLPGLHPLAKHFRATRDVAARLGGETMALPAGERLDLN